MFNLWQENLLSGCVWLAIHLRLYELLVSEHQCHLAVPVPHETPVVDVGTAYDRHPVIHYHDLVMHEDYLCH